VERGHSTIIVNMDKELRHREKEAKRAAKAAHRAAKEARLASRESTPKQDLRELKRAVTSAVANTPPPTLSVSNVPPGPLDCACVIHSNGYSWEYVEKLYNMLTRNVTRDIRLHVYTEEHRPVPDYMVKHILEEWPDVSGPKKSWWYKLQLFNTEHHRGPMLYLDLDTVVVSNLDWVETLSTKYFWSIRDFRYLWKSNSQGINSSMMWWDTTNFSWIWDGFKRKDLTQVRRTHHGDQDYLSTMLDHRSRRFFDSNRVVSWRWQALDGGLDFLRRRHKNPGLGTKIDPETSVLIFHGHPKPAAVKDEVIKQHWV
jgi:hypothetical protein